MNTRSLGTKMESEAKAYLIRNGYEIIANNFRCNLGEIDLIAKDKEYLVFIEVKYRSSTKNGLPHESVDHRKIRRIVNTARFYMLQHGYPEFTPCRFDVVVFLEEQIELIQNAFDAY